MKLALALVLVVSFVVAAAPENAPVVAEVEIEGKGELARITVYLLNKSGTEQTLFSGQIGTSRSGEFRAVDLDQVATGKPFGNGTLAVPEFTFGSIKFKAPIPVEYGKTWHTMRPTLIKLKDGDRLLYCQFSVPASYVQGEFVLGKISFPVLSGATAANLEVPVTKCERKKSDTGTK